MNNEDIETFEQRLLKLLTGSKSGKIISITREFTEHNLHSTLAKPAVVSAVFFTSNGSVINADIELSETDLQKLTKGM